MFNDFLSNLEKEHSEVRKLLEQLENSSKRVSTNEGDPIDQLKLTLISQMKGEEQQFCSLLAHLKQVRNKRMGSQEEHHFTELVLKELDKLNSDIAPTDPRCEVFDE